MIEILIASVIIVVGGGGMFALALLGFLHAISNIRHYMEETERKDGTNGNH